MPGFNAFLNDPKAAKLMGDPQKLKQLKDAPETQQLFSMLSRSAGGDLEQAADQAAKGDAGQLMSAIRRLLTDPEGARLVEQVKEKLK